MAPLPSEGGGGRDGWRRSTHSPCRDAGTSRQATQDGKGKGKGKGRGMGRGRSVPSRPSRGPARHRPTAPAPSRAERSGPAAPSPLLQPLPTPQLNNAPAHWAASAPNKPRADWPRASPSSRPAGTELVRNEARAESLQPAPASAVPAAAAAFRFRPAVSWRRGTERAGRGRPPAGANLCRRAFVCVVSLCVRGKG